MNLVEGQEAKEERKSNQPLTELERFVRTSAVALSKDLQQASDVLKDIGFQIDAESLGRWSRANGLVVGVAHQGFKKEALEAIEKVSLVVEQTLGSEANVDLPDMALAFGRVVQVVVEYQGTKINAASQPKKGR